MLRLAAAAALLVHLACSPPTWRDDDPRCDAWIGETCFLFETPQPTATPERLDRLVARADEVWSAPTMRGWRVRFAESTGCTASSYACAFLDREEIVIRADGRSQPCAAVVVIHEAGHTVLAGGDGRHLDPRWADEAQRAMNEECVAILKEIGWAQ
jgi:hypothetical protein